MLIKPFSVPTDIYQLESANKRVNLEHQMRERILGDLKKSKVGYYGEKEVFYQLQFLPQDEFHILHNVRLVENSRNFQIDFLVLWHDFIFILNVKNFKGSVYFNNLGQLVHIRGDDTEEYYENPVNQAARHKLQLQNWLKINSFPALSIESLVILGPATKYIESKSNNFTILNNITTYSNILPIILNYTKTAKTTPFKKFDNQHLATKLVKSHIPFQRNILMKYNLNKDDLMSGVHCTQCNSLSMVYRAGWICSNCNYYSKMEYIYSLNDYYFLIDDKISTSQAAQFLNLEKDYITKYLLQKARYDRVGKTSSSKYILRYIPQKKLNVIHSLLTQTKVIQL